MNGDNAEKIASRLHALAQKAKKKAAPRRPHTTCFAREAKLRAQNMDDEP
jgi:hypothetical protein